MNPQEQQYAIARTCGWKDADHPDVVALKDGWAMPEKWCMDPKGVLRLNNDRPDYLNDLNAMHEAEQTLTDEQWLDYVRELTDSHSLSHRHPAAEGIHQAGVQSAGTHDARPDCPWG